MSRPKARTRPQAAFSGPSRPRLAAPALARSLQSELPVPSVLPRLVRPCLDGLSLLVFLFALAAAVGHVRAFTGDHAAPSAEREQLEELAGLLKEVEAQRPGALAAMLAADEPLLSALREQVRRPRLKLLDPYDRPLVLTPLAGEWLFELRSRGHDGRLHTEDDQYFWVSRAGEPTFHDQPGRPEAADTRE
jgi:hypothetical protein